MLNLTIVTVSFNAIDCIENTIQSVVNQCYVQKEYVVIDGGSKDGTKDVIQQYANYLSYWVSEPDGGIYFGMNKGIQAATGDYVLFLNAGDIFADNQTLTQVANAIEKANYPDVVYGDCLELYEYGEYFKQFKDITLMPTDMVVSHQATLVKTSILKEHLFNTRYRLAADYEQLSRLYLEHYRFVYIPVTIAKMEMTDGATYKHFQQSVVEHQQILASRGIGSRPVQKTLLLRKKIVRFIKKVLPKCIKYPLFRFIAAHYKAL